MGLCGGLARGSEVTRQSPLAWAPGGRALTSRRKISAAVTWEKLGTLTSGLRCVLAEGAEVKGGQG